MRYIIIYLCSCAHWIVGTVLAVIYMHDKANSIPMCAPSHPAQVMRPAAGIGQDTSFAVGGDV